MAEDTAEAPADTGASRPEAVLPRLFAGEWLSADEAEALFGALVRGQLDERTIAAMLVAMRVRGETEQELIGAARALRAADAPFPRPDYLFADSCGTGGDGTGSINVSTAAAFVAAACGLPVAKHGNRSFSSRCGSADVLEQLGARLDVPAETSRRALDETGFCFLLAPRYHPGLLHAAPVRRMLKTRTIMNLLGPCLNPAEPPVQLLGVAEARLIEPVARTLAALGVERALVVHGSGADEVALHGETDAVRLDRGKIERIVITPEQAGLARAPLSTLKGGGPEENAERLKTLLMGEGSNAETAVVALNAGALLMTAGFAVDVREGSDIAAASIAAGSPYEVLQGFIEATNG